MSLCDSYFALCVYVPYGYTGLYHYDLKHIMGSLEYGFLWRIYVEGERVAQLMRENQLFPVKNCVCVGYPKMDSLATLSPSKASQKKTIIIAPHHTITDWKELQLSNFLKYDEFFLELPNLYPEIHFIFRPHPLLFSTLKNNPHLWDNSVENYLEKIKKIPNMHYDDSSDYFQTFVDSSALIHDCGSYVAEYLYTDKPVCFMVRDRVESHFNAWGQKVVKHLYLAFEKEQILEFIENVVISGKDKKKEKRVQFAKKQIRVNFPHAGREMVKEMTREIFG